MPKRTKTCRVCGKTYESCRSIKTGSSVFNWREMCCSPECGQIYFQRIKESRNPTPAVKERKVHVRRETPVKTAPMAPETVSVDEQEEQHIEESEEN